VLYFYFVIHAVRHCKSTTYSTEAKVISFIKSCLVRSSAKIESAMSLKTWTSLSKGTTK